MNTIKQQLLNTHLAYLQDKIDVFKDMIAALSSDAQNDAKSSAGDKHETALSMMHLEQEKLNMKLMEFSEQKQRLQKIEGNLTTTVIGLGSLVQTDRFWVFISEALPKVTIAGQTVFSVSPKAPLGSLLIGKKLTESVQVNGTTYTVLQIL